MPENWTTVCRCGNVEVSVEPEMVCSGYAVHKTIGKGHAGGPGYTVTHRSSGYAVWHVRTFVQAIAVAQWLADNLELPADLDGVLRWRANLEPRDRTRLVVNLTEIAPREWVTA